MKHMKNAKKHLTFNLLLFSCAMLLLTIYASRILASDVNSLTAETVSTTEKVVTDTTQKQTTALPVTTTVSPSAIPTTTKTTETLTQDVTKTTAQTATAMPVATTSQEATSKNTASSNNTVTNVTPTFVFTSPQNGKTVETKIDITGTVSTAKNVEFYLIPENSNTKKYLGTAKKYAENNWGIFGFELRNIPNGVFFLIARIENSYGTYESGKIKITISVPSSNPTAENTGNPSTTQTTKTANNAPTNTTTAIEQSTTANANQSPVNTQTENYNGETSIEWQRKYFGNENCARKEYCGGNSDPDNDGLSNNDEYRYKTNPLNPDTDGDGYLDGVEVKNGFDPLKASQENKTDKIVFENPKENGVIKKETYAITDVELIKVDNEKRLKLTGKGLPDSFVTVYVYSSLPIIFTVKTDANGDWSYTMDKQLDDGEHEVYVAVTDNTGKITAKSEPLPFVKTAEAATATGKDAANARAKASLAPTEARTSSDLLLIFAIILLSLGLVFSVISLTVVYRAQKEKL